VYSAFCPIAPKIVAPTPQDLKQDEAHRNIEMLTCCYRDITHLFVKCCFEALSLTLGFLFLLELEVTICRQEGGAGSRYLHPDWTKICILEAAYQFI